MSFVQQREGTLSVVPWGQDLDSQRKWDCVLEGVDWGPSQQLQWEQQDALEEKHVKPLELAVAPSCEQLCLVLNQNPYAALPEAKEQL
jgi:hypothetical protein